MCVLDVSFYSLVLLSQEWLHINLMRLFIKCPYVISFPVKVSMKHFPVNFLNFCV